MGRAVRAIGRRFAAVAGVLRSRDLRRLQAGWAAFFLVTGHVRFFFFFSFDPH